MKYGWKFLLLWTALFRSLCSGLPNPIGLYPLNGNQKAKDISCHGNPEGKLSDVKLSRGPDSALSGAYKFFGSKTSYIEIPGNSLTDVKYSVTLLASVYHTGYSGPIIDYAHDGLGVNLWMTGPDTLNGRFITRDGGNNIFLSSNKNFRYVWHYVGLTYNYVTGTAELYIDGERVRKHYLGRTELKTKGLIRLGAVEHDDRYFKGKISCLQIYDKALTESEIREVQRRCSNKDTVNCSTVTTPSCNEQHMTSTSGSFSSPGYPRGYQANSDCIWTIKVPSGKKIILTFSDMDLHESPGCPDHVQVLDGLTSWSSELRKFCHSTVGKNNKVKSSANSLRVEFRSDGVVSGKGFTASYTTQDIETSKGERVIDLSIHYTGIVIGVACAALFTILSIMAVSHTRRRMRRRSSTFSERPSSECHDAEDDVIRQGAPPSYDLVMRCPDLYPPSPQMSPASSITSTPLVNPRFKIPPRITSPLASGANSPVFSPASPWNSGQLSSNPSRNTSPDHEDPPPYPGIVVVRGDTVLGPRLDLLYDRQAIPPRLSTPTLHSTDMRGLMVSDTGISSHPRIHSRTRSSDLMSERASGLHRLHVQPQRRTQDESQTQAMSHSRSSPGISVGRTACDNSAQIRSDTSRVSDNSESLSENNTSNDSNQNQESSDHGMSDSVRSNDGNDYTHAHNDGRSRDSSLDMNGREDADSRPIEHRREVTV